MKTATTNLENDHAQILKLIAVMQAIVRMGTPDIKHIEEIIVIIRNFADGLHHTKEEKLLFPTLESKGLSPFQGPVAVMLYEHNQGRIFVKGIADNLELYKNGKSEAIDELFKNMTGYAELLISHITKENNILFRLADRKLSADEHTKLLAEFERIDSAGSSDINYNVQIENLASFYKV